MYECLNGINTNICKIVGLLCAGDGTIMMQSLQEARQKHTSTDRNITEMLAQYKQKKKQHTDIQ